MVSPPNTTKEALSSAFEAGLRQANETAQKWRTAAGVANEVARRTEVRVENLKATLAEAHATIDHLIAALAKHDPDLVAELAGSHYIHQREDPEA